MKINLNLNPNFLKPEKLEKKPSRDGAGLGVLELGRQRSEVVVVTTDVAGSTRANLFAKEFPQRFIQLGVAEQNAIGVCAGLAYQGLIPYYFAYSVFAIGRNWEPIRTLLAYPQNKVRIIASHAGVATGPDGATHQMTEDFALMRVLPNFTVISPADFQEAQKAVKAVVDLPGPVYLRLTRANFPVFTTEKTPFEVGKILELKSGQDLTIIATGSVVYNALLAAFELEKKKISARVLNCHTIKPLDAKAILKAAKETKKLVVVEDHQKAAGLGSAVAELVCQHYPVPLLFLGIPDRFGESGEAEELYRLFGLDKEGIFRKIKDWFLKIKR
jgi:transketolase